MSDETLMEKLRRAYLMWVLAPIVAVSFVHGLWLIGSFLVARFSAAAGHGQGDAQFLRADGIWTEPEPTRLLVGVNSKDAALLARCANAAAREWYVNEAFACKRRSAGDVEALLCVSSEQGREGGQAQ